MYPCAVLVVYDQITALKITPDQDELHRLAQQVIVHMSPHVVTNLVPIHDETAKA
jgi:hypothetical protein